MNICTTSRTSRSTRRLAVSGLVALTAVMGLAACGDDEPAQQMEEKMEDTGSDVMTETTEAMMEEDSMTESTDAMTDDSMMDDSMMDDSMTDDSMTDDSMTESTDAMTDESMTESTGAMTEATTAP